MARPRKTEECLEALRHLRETLASPEARAELRQYLANKSSTVVAQAAKLAGEFEIHELRPQLGDAFARFLNHPATSDRGCVAKLQIVRALEALGAPEQAVFLAGIRHVQMEGSFGPPIDTAAGLRAASAIGLVRMNHPNAILEIVTLLVDREADARLGAVRALAYSGRPEAVPLVRLKALQADPSVDVMGECFTVLMAIAPESSLDFVAAYLDAPNAAVAEAAALALGESHESAAIEALKNKWRPEAPESLRRAMLTGLALARQESAFEFLFSLAVTAGEKTAAEVISALAMYRHDDRIRSRVASLVASSHGSQLERTFEAEFTPP